MGFAQLRKKFSPSSLDEMSRRRDSLSHAITAAEAEFDAANHERLRLLIDEDDASGPALAAADRRCREAQDDLTARRDAHDALSRKIETLQAEAATKANKAERDRVAADIEQRADLIEEATREVSLQVDVLAEFVSRLSKTIAECGAVAGAQAIPPTPWSVLDGVVRAEMSRKLPGFFGSFFSVDGGPGPSALSQIRHHQTDAMRAAAQALRAGQAAPELAAFRKPASTSERHEADETIVLSTPVQYMGATGPVQLNAGSIVAPAIVAERCRELEIAFDPGSREALAIESLLRAQPAATIVRREDGTFATNKVVSGKSLAPPRGWLDIGVNVATGEVTPTEFDSSGGGVLLSASGAGRPGQAMGIVAGPAVCSEAAS